VFYNDALVKMNFTVLDLKAYFKMLPISNTQNHYYKLVQLVQIKFATKGSNSYVPSQVN